MTSVEQRQDQQLDITQLPSLKDGLSVTEEATRRRKTCRFIEEAGRCLKLPRVAVATAMVFFHRFYAKHSFNDHDRFEVAVACIILAAKTEESPRKVQQVLTECYQLKQRGMAAAKAASRSGTPTSSASPPSPQKLDPGSKEFSQLKERTLLLERVILHTIGFELSVDHPYKYLVEEVQQMVTVRKELEYCDSSKESGGQNAAVPLYKRMMNEMVQCAMNFANDSLQTSLCLQFSSRRIAKACVYLAAQFARTRPTGNRDWRQVWGPQSNLDVAALASVSTQILELIGENRRNSPEQMALISKIRQSITTLRGVQQPPRPPNARPPPPPPPNAKRPRV